jgi:hypothetical protein
MPAATIIARVLRIVGWFPLAGLSGRQTVYFSRGHSSAELAQNAGEALRRAERKRGEAVALAGVRRATP